MKIEQKNFGLIHGKVVQNIVFETDGGFLVEISPFGATIVDVQQKDKIGQRESVILGFDHVEDYQKYRGSYFGCTVGRVAGRIENAQFSLEGKTYTLAKNDNKNNLHGGVLGFHQQLFQVKEMSHNQEEAKLVLTYDSKDLEEGFPGNVHLEVTYLIRENHLSFIVDATTDQKTIIDITNHVGFNLSGNAKESIRGHFLSIDAAQYSPLNVNYIPGNLKGVENTVFDFQTPRIMEEALSSQDAQIKLAGGIDHPFFLNHQIDPSVTLFHEPSGRLLKISTTQKAVVVYSGNFLSEKVIMRNKQKGFKNAMVCLETQSLPNAINNPTFPSIVLDKGQPYHQQTIYQFGIKK